MNPTGLPPIRLSRSSAMRSNSLSHVDVEQQTALEQEIENQQKERDKNYHQLRTIAALADHPGWKILAAQFLKNIEGHRSGTAYASAYEKVRKGEMTLAQYGELTFTGYTIANELTVLLNSVAVSQESVEQLNEEERNAAITARRVMGPTPETENQ